MTLADLIPGSITSVVQHQVCGAFGPARLGWDTADSSVLGDQLPAGSLVKFLVFGTEPWDGNTAWIVETQVDEVGLVSWTAGVGNGDWSLSAPTFGSDWQRVHVATRLVLRRLSGSSTAGASEMYVHCQIPSTRQAA